MPHLHVRVFFVCYAQFNGIGAAWSSSNSHSQSPPPTYEHTAPPQTVSPSALIPQVPYAPSSIMADISLVNGHQTYMGEYEQPIHATPDLSVYGFHPTAITTIPHHTFDAQDQSERMLLCSTLSVYLYITVTSCLFGMCKC